MSFAWRKRLFILVFPLLLALTYGQLRVESDLNAFFTATDSEDSALLAGLLQSGEMSRRYLGLVTGANGDTQGAGVVTDALIQRLERLDGVERAWRMDQPPREWAEAVQAYAPFAPLIFSLDPRSESTLFDPTRLAQRAMGLQQALLSPQGGFLKPILKQDPLLLALQGFRGLEGIMQGEGSAGRFVLQSHAPSLNVAAQAQLQAAIRAEFDRLNAERGGAYRLSMTGIPVFTVATSEAIGRDVTLVSVVSSIGVTLVFLLLFRSFAALHWMLLIQAASFAAGALTTALVFGRVHSLTLALGASLIGICTDYPIHVLVHSAKSRFVSPLQAVKLVWPSLVMGGLTTVIGYGALGLTGFPGLEQIAVFAVGGIAASLFLTRWVLPALLGKARLHPAHLPGIHAWVLLCARYRRPLAWLLLGLSLAALVALPRMRWMDDLQKLSVDMSTLRQQDALIRAGSGSIEPGRFVLVQALDMESALQRSEAAERRLRVLKSEGGLAGYRGIFPWLVSASLQQANGETYRAALTPQFREAWREALATAGLSVEKLGALPDVPAGAMLMPEAALAGEAVSAILSGQVIPQNGQVALVIWLGHHDPAKVEAALQGLDGVRYFSQRDVMNRVAQQHRDRSLEMLGWGILVMAGLIWLQQRSLRRVALTLLPTLASVLFIMAAWALVGEEVSFLHVIGLLLSVSLCVDYGIFFMDNRVHDTDITYHAIASSTLTTLASFGAMALARTPTLPILSVSVTLGVTLGFLLCPLLVSADRSPDSVATP